MIIQWVNHFFIWKRCGPTYGRFTKKGYKFSSHTIWTFFISLQNTIFHLPFMGVTFCIFVIFKQIFQVIHGEMSLNILLFINYTTAQGFLVGLSLENLFLNSTCLRLQKRYKASKHLTAQVNSRNISKKVWNVCKIHKKEFHEIIKKPYFWELLCTAASVATRSQLVGTICRNTLFSSKIKT